MKKSYNVVIVNVTVLPMKFHVIMYILDSQVSSCNGSECKRNEIPNGQYICDC